MSLAVKLNLIVIAAIILVSANLLVVSYRVYGERIDDVYFDRLENASETSAYIVNPEGLAFLWQCIDTDEFKAIREKAVAANDERQIIEWMKSIDARHLSSDSDDARGQFAHLSFDYTTLYDVYMSNSMTAEYVQNSAGITSAYFQFMQDGDTYNLVDPEFGPLAMGSIEDPLPEFANFADNELVPPTVFHTEDRVFCTTCVPIYDEETGEAVAMFCFDADMNEAMAQRWGFLISCIVFVLLVTVLVAVVSLYLVRRFATKPLRQLTEATCDFYEGTEAPAGDDTIELDIHSDDEIGELYREIRSMQNRIASYTQNMAREAAEKERAKTELGMATSIQESMLPNVFPCFPDRSEFEIYATMDPAKDVGGDFYDFFLIDDNHLALIIADVSGKGVPAALFMMAVKIMLDDRAMVGGMPAEILGSVNAKICDHNETKTFVTVWMGILDITSGVMTCSNAGHNYPWIRGADGTFRMLRDKHGLVVGGVKNIKYTDYTIELQPGDAIFVHTDGVNEAINPAHEFFGTARLEEALNGCPGSDPEGILRAVRKSVDAFADGAERFDDITMLCMEYRGCGKSDDGADVVADSGCDDAEAKELALPAAPESVSKATEFVMRELDALQCPKPARTQIAVAIDEIISNIVKFAYEAEGGNLTMSFATREDGAVAEISFVDQGCAYNPLETAEPDVTLGAQQRTIGGLGVFLVKKTMDDVEYERKDDKNILRIRKRIRN